MRGATQGRGIYSSQPYGKTGGKREQKGRGKLDTEERLAQGEDTRICSLLGLALAISTPSIKSCGRIEAADSAAASPPST